MPTAFVVSSDPVLFERLQEAIEALAEDLAGAEGAYSELPEIETRPVTAWDVITNPQPTFFSSWLPVDQCVTNQVTVTGPVFAPVVRAGGSCNCATPFSAYAGAFPPNNCAPLNCTTPARTLPCVCAPATPVALATAAETMASMEFHVYHQSHSMNAGAGVLNSAPAYTSSTPFSLDMVMLDIGTLLAYVQSDDNSTLFPAIFKLAHHGGLVPDEGVIVASVSELYNHVRMLQSLGFPQYDGRGSLMTALVQVTGDGAHRAILRTNPFPPGGLVDGAPAPSDAQRYVFRVNFVNGRLLYIERHDVTVRPYFARARQFLEPLPLYTRQSSETDILCARRAAYRASLCDCYSRPYSDETDAQDAEANAVHIFFTDAVDDEDIADALFDVNALLGTTGATMKDGNNNDVAPIELYAAIQNLTAGPLPTCAVELIFTDVSADPDILFRPYITNVYTALRFNRTAETDNATRLPANVADTAPSGYEAIVTSLFPG